MDLTCMETVASLNVHADLANALCAQNKTGANSNRSNMMILKPSRLLINVQQCTRKTNEKYTVATGNFSMSAAKIDALSAVMWNSSGDASASVSLSSCYKCMHKL